MKKAILLHGWAGKSDNHWFPWMKKELEELGYEVFAPDLTATRLPVLEDQLGDVEEIMANFWKGDIVIGHSLGCQLGLHAIHKLELRNIKSIFVWPSFPGCTEMIDKNFAESVCGDAYDNLVEYNNEELELEDYDNEYIICLSENDEFINLEAAEDYYCMLENVEFLEFEDKWHFNTASEVFEIPELMEYLEE